MLVKVLESGLSRQSYSMNSFCGALKTQMSKASIEALQPILVFKVLNGSFAAKDIGEFCFLRLCNPLYWNRVFGILSRVSLENISS